MPITIIKGPDGVRTLLTTTETIPQGRVLRVAGEKKVALLTSGKETEVCGVSAEGVSSGALIRIITQGVVSGLLCAGTVRYGESVLGGIGLSGGALISGVAGLIRPAASGFNVGAILGKALNSGGVGSGIAVLVDLG